MRSAALLFLALAADHRRMADGKEWKTRNLDVAVEPSSCYDNIPANCQRYGRLYEWDSAGRACAALGDGWRLPTNDEWAALVRGYGALIVDDKARSHAAFQSLRPGGASGFEALLSGGRQPDGTYARGEAHGFYWTATESDAGHAWFYNFGRGMGAVNRHAEGEKKRAFAVRCVRDAASK